MKYLSICSGIEAATVAWHPLGWEAVAFAEIEKFPSAVLKHHWPDVPNLGDMTRFREWPESVFLEADCIIAGTPCQAFSVAGRRRSLEDERGNLTLTFTRIIDHARTIRTAAGRPEAIILWENVPGCLSTKDNAFGCFLSELSGNDVTAIKKWPSAGRVLGEKRRVAWRIIDAQFAGVPQRRRRVFCVSVNAQAVADSRTASPEQILFIGQSLRGDLEKSKEQGEEVTGTLGSRSKAGGGFGTDFECAGGLQPIDAHGECQKIANPLTARMAKGINTTLDEGQTPIVETLAPAVTTGAPFSKTGNSRVESEAMVAIAQAVRRLTPVECERLQGFPDNYTRIPWRGKPAEQCPDGSRYKALGNSMAVPVIRWLGQRIQAGMGLKNL